LTRPGTSTGFTDRHETVIVGGGIAGLACARTLHGNGRSFLLITEDLGGRVRASTDGHVNLGAYYVRGDYRHVNRFVDRGRRIRRREIACGEPDGSFSRLVMLLIRHPRQTARFLRLMREFRRHYETFQRTSLTVSQAEALEADPLLWGLYHEPASAFIHRHRIEGVAQSFLSPATQATAFTSVDRLTALTLLVGALPAITAFYEYTFRFDRLTRGFEDSLLFDSATRVARREGHFWIQTRDGREIEAENVVVATPIDVSARLLELGPVKAAIDAHMFLLRGVLRDPWARAEYNLFPDGDPVFAIARQEDGSILFCAASSHPDFARCLSSWEVVEYHHWKPAFHLVGDALLGSELGPGLYLIGDHNVCDLEDAFITGVHAAGRISAGPLPSSRAAATGRPPTSLL
jgi:glycine/D-amino acid oxidase-like deaminating enzyme